MSPRLGLVLALALALTTSGCILGRGGDGSSEEAASKKAVEVTMDARGFAPGEVWVETSTPVVFRNGDKTGATHLVLAANGAWALSETPPGSKASKAFLTPGEYPYVCAYHEGEGMRGVIHVTT